MKSRIVSKKEKLLREVILYTLQNNQIPNLNTPLRYILNNVKKYIMRRIDLAHLDKKDLYMPYSYEEKLFDNLFKCIESDYVRLWDDYHYNLERNESLEGHLFYEYNKNKLKLVNKEVNFIFRELKSKNFLEIKTIQKKSRSYTIWTGKVNIDNLKVNKGELLMNHFQVPAILRK